MSLHTMSVILSPKMPFGGALFLPGPPWTETGSRVCVSADSWSDRRREPSIQRPQRSSRRIFGSSSPECAARMLILNPWVCGMAHAMAFWRKLPG